MKFIEIVIDSYPDRGQNPQTLEVINNCVYSKFIPQHLITRRSIYLIIAFHKILIHRSIKKSNYFKLK